MAAEKLTKGRLIQIICTFIVLISAFVWRTMNEPETTTDKGEIQIQCIREQVCEFEFSEARYRLNDLGDNVTISLVSQPQSDTVITLEYQQKEYAIDEKIPVQQGTTYSMILHFGNASAFIELVENKK